MKRPLRQDDAPDAPPDIPLRSKNPARWKLLAIALVFAAWLAFLVYCAVAGN
jgi:hypothetical protein